jgi:hypothetical protein
MTCGNTMIKIAPGKRLKFTSFTRNNPHARDSALQKALPLPEPLHCHGSTLAVSSTNPLGPTKHRRKALGRGWEPRGDNGPANGPSLSYPARAPTNDGSFTAAPDGTFLPLRDSRETAICESAASGNQRIDSLNSWRMIRAFWTGRGVAFLLVTLCAFLNRIGRCAASPFGEVHAVHACLKGPNG